MNTTINNVYLKIGNIRGRLYIFLFVFILNACSSQKIFFNPNKKFSPQQLKSDYQIFRAILEERHPSLYWYSSKASMDKAFDKGFHAITDSLTEPEFRKILGRVCTRIQCGHTSVRPSSKYSRYLDTLRNKPVFPLYLKIWNDTAVVAYNIFKNDSNLVRGTLIDSINGKGIKELIDTMYQYIPADGNNPIAKDQRLSTATYFGALYHALFGATKTYRVSYTNKEGTKKTVMLSPYNPPLDTARGAIMLQKKRKIPRKERLERERYFMIDSIDRFAIMEVNSFSEKLRLRSFFRIAFKKLNQRNIENLIIDLRSNGGGRLNNSNLLIKYLATSPFKLGDSVFASTRKTAYDRYIKNNWISRWVMCFYTKKKQDGNYHFTWYEKHFFKPRKRNHFKGTVYLLTGGNSFSATALAIGTLRDQSNIIVLGEPTGGAAYGNSALFIPDATLPQTKIRLWLPLFRLVVHQNQPQNGKGVWPEIYVEPTTDAIRNGVDYKMEKAKQLILR